MTKFVSLLSALLLSFSFTAQAKEEAPTLSPEQAMNIAYETLDFDQFLNVLNGQPTAIVFEHINYKGRALVATGNVSSFVSTESFNDIASSILVFNGAKVQLFLHVNYKGPYIVFSSNNADFRNLSFNDAASSLKFY